MEPASFVESSQTLSDNSVQSEHPAIQSLKAALYLENADGFGDWRILLNGRAYRDLRSARREDRAYFKIIIRKMKCAALICLKLTRVLTDIFRELSNGRFSADNQKRLNGGSNSGVPIYEAKVNGDVRLVVRK